jgi:hypothetical protein
MRRKIHLAASSPKAEDKAAQNTFVDHNEKRASNHSGLAIHRIINR